MWEVIDPEHAQKARQEMPPRARSTAKRTPRNVNPEPSEIDEDDAEEIEEPEPAPKRRGRPRRTDAEKPAAATKTTRRRTSPAKTEEPASASQSNGYGTAWLVEHVNEECGTDLDGKALRVILRELAESGIIQRDDRSRYSFKGPRDKQVLAVIRAVKTAARDDEKPARGRPAKKETPAAKTAPARRGRSRKTAEPEPDPDLPDFEDDEEMEDDEIEDL